MGSTMSIVPTMDNGGSSVVIPPPKTETIPRIKVVKYDGLKTYMYPNGELATPERVLKDYPAILTFPHIIETDDAGQIIWAVDNLSAIRSIMGIDVSLSEANAISRIQTIRNDNADPAKNRAIPSPEERIAAAMEFQNLNNM